MRKLAGLALSLTVLMSLSACRTGNLGMGNRNYGGTNSGANNGTNIGRTSTINNTNRGNYKDGVYTGLGNSHVNGNERATVTIRNGLIADIDLSSDNQQGTANYGNTTGTRTTNQGTANSQAGNSYGNNMGTGFGTGTGFETGTNGNVGSGFGVGTNNGTVTGVDNNTGIGIGQNIANTATDAIRRAKTSLVNAIIQNQTHNVTVNENDASIRTKIDNWKLAVSRALDQARR